MRHAWPIVSFVDLFQPGQDRDVIRLAVVEE
jgi:hypothetical protein